MEDNSEVFYLWSDYLLTKAQLKDILSPREFEEYFGEKKDDN